MDHSSNHMIFVFLCQPQLHMICLYMDMLMMILFLKGIIQLCCSCILCVWVEGHNLEELINNPFSSLFSCISFLFFFNLLSSQDFGIKPIHHFTSSTVFTISNCRHPLKKFRWTNIRQMLYFPCQFHLFFIFYPPYFSYSKSKTMWSKDKFTFITIFLLLPRKLLLMPFMLSFPPFFLIL